MSNWNTRIKIAREDAGLDKAEFARRVGVSGATATDWESGKIKSLAADNLLAAAKVTGVEPEWLLHGKGPMRQSDPEDGIGSKIRTARQRLGLTQEAFGELAGVTKGAVSQWESGLTSPDLSAVTALLAKGVDIGALPARPEPNVTPGPDIRGRVPLISWVQAGGWVEVADLLTPGDGEDWIETTVQVRPHTYALRVQGDSMAPEFPPGSLIVVEPELDPQPGDYVIAKNGDEATFKQLVRDGGDWYLKPCNDRYPIKPLSASKVIGVVREVIRRFR